MDYDNVITLKDRRRQRICHQRDKSWIESRRLVARTMLIDAEFIIDPEKQLQIRDALRKLIQTLGELA